MPRVPMISAPVGKSGPLISRITRLEHLLAVRLGVREHPLGGRGHLAQVVRRDLGGHADRDARGAVDEKVREAARQHVRLEGLAVVVGAEVDGLLVDVAHHLHRQRRHPALARGPTHTVKITLEHGLRRYKVGFTATIASASASLMHTS